jgi:hypothetical protein
VTATTTSRLGAAFVFVLLAVGSAALWIGVPIAGMWLAGELTDSFAWHMPLALVLVVAGVIACGAALVWLDDLYLRLTGGRARLGPDGTPVRRRGPLEQLLVVALILALISFAVWFLVFAKNPDLRVW